MGAAAPGDTAPADSSHGEDGEKEEGSFILFVIKLVLVVLIFRSFIFSPFSIPSESMLPRLMNGDYLLAAKWPYGFSKYSLPGEAPLIPGRIFADEPERGDVVIFKHPVDGIDYIKRAIGLPGDRIALQGGQLVLNGTPVPKVRTDDLLVPLSQNTQCHPSADLQQVDGKFFCRYARYTETLPGGDSYEVLDFGLRAEDDFGPVVVPAGHIFVMGDNRDNSQDSRFAARAGGGVGMVPMDLLVARASRIMWSTDGGSQWLKPWTWFTSSRGDRIGEGL